MTKELDTVHTAEAVPMPDVSDNAIDFLKQQAEAMSTAHQLAEVLCRTQMVPQTFRGKPDDGAAAILYGAELGLKPQQALQQVFVVHGQPAIYARTMVGLLKARGYRFETVESTDESVTVTATSPRGETETSTWTIDRAKKAGYTSNKKYATDPQAMLYAKAASEVSRKIAPDVLLGIKYAAEDLELEPQPVRAQATRLDKPQRGAARLKAALNQAPTVDVDSIITAFNACQSLDDLAAVVEQAKAIPADHPQREAAELAYAAKHAELIESEQA